MKRKQTKRSPLQQIYGAFLRQRWVDRYGEEACAMSGMCDRRHDGCCAKCFYGMGSLASAKWEEFKEMPECFTEDLPSFLASMLRIKEDRVAPYVSALIGCRFPEAADTTPAA